MPFGKEKLEAGKTVSLKKYYWRRLTRLEPPYFIAMTGLFLVLVLVMNESFRDLLPNYLVSLLYLHRVVYNDWTPINPPAWTLEVEVMFYLVAPFLARWYFMIRKPIVRRLALIGVIVFKVVLLNTTQLFDGLFLTIAYLIEFFLVGILLADFYLTGIKRSPDKNKYLFDLISIASILLLFTTWTWGKNLDFKFVFLTALFFVVYSSFQSRIMNKFLTNGWITAIGGMCYSIYLLHLAFAEMFVLVLKKIGVFTTYTNNFYFGFILFLPSLFIVTTVFFLLVEKPCMDPEWPAKLKRFFTHKTVTTEVSRDPRP
jgi:peptidoglycan/LPS O-acetylase OafA/YrhL